MAHVEHTTLVVLAARRGDPVPARDVVLPTIDRVIAVDSGLHLANRLGLEVDVLIGDLDSVDPVQRDEARSRGVEFDVHPRDKDRTDVALALARARDDGASDVLVVGGAGGRLDHGLANLLALADPELAGIRIRAILGGATIHVVRTEAVTLSGTPGSLVSILAVGGDAVVATEGLRWDLHGEVLAPTTTRGISNELHGPTATVAATTGVVLTIQPAPDEALDH